MSRHLYLIFFACFSTLGISHSQSLFTEIPVDTLAYSGCSAQLNCSISDLIVNATISWYARFRGSDQQISSGNNIYDHRFNVTGDHKRGEFHLLIVSAKTSIESVYKCKVNHSDLTRTVTAELFVLEAGPTCSFPFTRVIEHSTTVNIVCQIDLAEDAPGELVWRRNKLEVKRTLNKFSSHRETFDRSANGDEFTCLYEYHSASSCPALQSLICEEKFTVNVEYPPDVSISASNNAVIEGKGYSRSCSIDANPNATVKWTHSGSDVGNATRLSLVNVRRNQNGTYTCQANNTLGSASDSFLLDVQYLPKVEIEKVSDKIVEGRTYTRNCKADANPIATVQWRYGHVLDGNSGLLRLPNVKRIHSGRYECVGSNEFWDGSAGSKSQFFNLDVQYPPTVSTRERIVQLKGRGVLLSCHMESSNPPKDSIGWVLLNGQMQPGRTLRLTELTRDMTGYYTCVASNTFYDNTLGLGNSSTYLDVHYEPSIQQSKFSDKVEADVGANVSLNCVMSANPTPTFVWQKNGQNIAISSKEMREGTETTSTLTLTHVANADYGEYVSRATNYISEDQCKIRLVRTGLSSEVIIVTGCGLLIVVGVAVFLGYYVYWRRKNLTGQNQKRGESLGSELKDLGQGRNKDGGHYQDLCSTESEKPGTADIYMKLSESFHEFPREHVRMSQIIGTGSFGKVNMATASEIAGKSGMTVVAVKTVKDGTSVDDKRRLMAELKILQRIEPHRNILPLLGCCTEEEPIYVIMELMGQGNLLKYLRDYRRERTSDYANAALMKWVIKSKDLVSFGRQIAIGMQYLASKSFVHGELAAKTVLLTNDKRTCKLSNIGLRGDKDIEAIRVKERKIRLPTRWFAPETLFSGEYSTMSDVWSFGIVLWEITTLGKTPYPTAKNVMKVNDFISKGYRMKRPVYCDAKLYSVMARCWSENKSERPPFSQLATELGSMAKSRQDFIDVKKACADTPDYKKAANENCYETK